MASDIEAAATRTVSGLAASSAAKHGGRAAVRFQRDGDWRELTFAEVAEVVEEIALGLVDLGIEPGDRVCVLADTRPEWTYASFAVSTAGGVVVPIYPTNSPEECEWVAGNSEARAIVCEDAGQVAKIDAGPRRPARARVRRSSIDARADGDDHARRAARAGPRRGRAPSSPAPGRGRARRPVHDHLHVGHDRAAQGRRAHPRQLRVGRRDGQRARRSSPTRTSPTSTCRWPTSSR